MNSKNVELVFKLRATRKRNSNVNYVRRQVKDLDSKLYLLVAAISKK